MNKLSVLKPNLETNKRSRKVFLIIDGNNCLANNYFGVSEAIIQKHLENNQKLNLHIYSAVKRWVTILNKYQPDKVMFVFDSKEKVLFRKEIFPEYKSKSKPKPLLEESINTTKQLLDFLYMDYLSVPSYEADDIIATLTKRYKDEYDIYIWSKDKDLYQLVDDNVKLAQYDKNLRDLQIIDKEYIMQYEGLGPSEYLEYKLIYGDKSNNTPGIPGLYWTSLVKQLLREYKTIDNILQIKNPTRKVKRIILNLQLNAHIIDLNRKLVLLVDDLNLKPYEQKHKRRFKKSIGALYAFCKKNNLKYNFFNSLLPFFVQQHKKLYCEDLTEAILKKKAE